mmetsp:Transcript_31824/g.68742  ORF Transcript_31824/g.68742 Transcript_31824/m.68742 type:complete len:124 (+) Transcript_31824:930-1301(+)
MPLLVSCNRGSAVPAAVKVSFTTVAMGAIIFARAPAVPPAGTTSATSALETTPVVAARSRGLRSVKSDVMLIVAAPLAPTVVRGERVRIVTMTAGARPALAIDDPSRQYRRCVLICNCMANVL